MAQIWKSLVARLAEASQADEVDERLALAQCCHKLSALASGLLHAVKQTIRDGRRVIEKQPAADAESAVQLLRLLATVPETISMALAPVERMSACA